MKWQEVIDTWCDGRRMPIREAVFELVDDGFRVKIEGGRYFIKPPKKDKEKKCKDCKWFRDWGPDPINLHRTTRACEHPDRTFWAADLERGHTDKCGPQGKHWEAKDG